MDGADILVYSMDTDLAEKHIATGCSDGTVRLYNIKGDSLEVFSVLKGHAGPVTKALYTHFGELIVSADFTGRLIIWKAENGVYLKRFEKHVLEGPIYDIAVRYADTGISVFCGCSDGLLIKLVVDPSFECTEERKQVHRFGIPALSSNSECLVTAGYDSAIAVHMDGEEHYLKHHKAQISCVAVAPSNAFGKTVFATGDESGKLFVVVWKNKQPETQEIDLGAPCSSLSWSRAGFVLTASYGENSFKSFILGESGKMEEVPMEAKEQ